MTWRGHLEGHDFDFQTLVECFGEASDPSVHRPVPNECYVESKELESPDGTPDHLAAQALVRRINGVARATDSSFRPVKLSGRYTSDAGAVHVFAEAAMVARGRLTVGGITVDGDPIASPTRVGPRYLELAANDHDVAEVLAYLGQPTAQLDWVTLYKVSEIVEKAAGGTKAITGNGWATKAELDRFGASANHQALSGDAARHARMDGTPPPEKGISLQEGQALISRLVTAWMQGLIPKSASENRGGAAEVRNSW